MLGEGLAKDCASWLLYIAPSVLVQSDWAITWESACYQ